MGVYEVRYEATEEADDDVRVLMSVWREGTQVAVLVAEAADADVANIAESAGVEGSGDDRGHVLAALAHEVATTVEGKALDRREGEAVPRIVHRPNAGHLLGWARVRSDYPALHPGATVHRFERGSG